MRTLVLGIAVTVAGCSYNPGSFEYPGRRFPGQRVTVGCLDISVDRRADLDDAAVLEYQFGNGCDEAVVVDLVRVPVVARTERGDEVALAAYDPNVEMMAMKLAARQAGGEAIAYRATEPTGPFAQVCVDAAAINADATERRWLCFGSAQLASPPTTIAEVTP